MTELQKILIIVQMATQAAGLVSDIADLLRRVAAGETITDEEIQVSQAAMTQAIAGWDSATKPPAAEPLQPADG